MIPEQEIREALCEVGRRVWSKNLVASNDGNLSFRLSEDQVLCTPTMISKGFMAPEDMVLIDMEGNKIAGHRDPTSEVRIHLFLYQNRPDIYSVVHVHPPHAVAFAMVQEELPKGLLPEVEVNLGEVPLVPYVTQGTWEFARSLEPWARTHDAFLLANHGAVTVGRDPFDAYYKMETLDQYCRVVLLARQLGALSPLPEKALDQLLAIKQRMGIADFRDRARLTEPGVEPTAARDLPPFAPFQSHPGPLEDTVKPGGPRFAGDP